MSQPPSEVMTVLLITPIECARVLRVDLSTVYRAMAQGRLPTVRVAGRTVRVPVARLAEELKITPEALIQAVLASETAKEADSQ